MRVVDSYYKELAERFRTTRKTLGLSEQEGADAAGVTVRTYRKWERAEVEVRTPYVVKFCNALDVSVNWFITGSGRFIGYKNDDLVIPLPLLTDGGPRSVERIVRH